MILLHSPKTDKTFEISGKILTVFSEGGCKSLDYLKRYIFSLVLVCLKTHSGIWSAILRPSLFFSLFFLPLLPCHPSFPLTPSSFLPSFLHPLPCLKLNSTLTSSFHLTILGNLKRYIYFLWCYKLLLQISLLFEGLLFGNCSTECPDNHVIQKKTGPL